jgi:hypothetical protein
MGLTGGPTASRRACVVEVVMHEASRTTQPRSASGSRSCTTRVSSTTSSCHGCRSTCRSSTSTWSSGQPAAPSSSSTMFGSTPRLPPSYPMQVMAGVFDFPNGASAARSACPGDRGRLDHRLIQLVAQRVRASGCHAPIARSGSWDEDLARAKVSLSGHLCSTPIDCYGSPTRLG